jgi:glycosyltransferase involved in cell wall biosynthesis
MRTDHAADSRRLVCLTTSAARGGAETSLMTLLTALRQLDRRWAVTVIAPSAGPLFDDCRNAGIATHVLPYPPALSRLGETGTRAEGGGILAAARFALTVARAALELPRYLLALRRLLAGQRIGVLHTNGVKAHIVGALAKPRGVRLVWQLHDYVQSRPVTGAVLRRLARRADAIVANSDSVGRDASAAFGAAAHVRRIYNAVDPGVFRPDGPALDLAALAGLPADAALVRIGLVATFATWKGHDIFVDAIARLRDDGHPVRGYIVGDAVYETAGSQRSRAELEHRVAQQGLSAVVGFTGHVDDVAAAMRGLDIVVHASTQPEPFGMVIAEAMASGRPLVAVKAGGASELFEDGADALGYAAGNAAELAVRLGQLIVDPARRAALAASARRTACVKFTPERMACEFREVYQG